MPNKLAHFAIEAQDVPRALAFYVNVFGWSFEPWGPPDFYLIHGAGVHGALQKREHSDSEPSAEPPQGYVCTFAVDDLKTTMALIAANGGTVHGDSHTIPTVGKLGRFADTEGNSALLMQYEPERAREMNL